MRMPEKPQMAAHCWKVEKNMAKKCEKKSIQISLREDHHWTKNEWKIAKSKPH